MDKRTLIKYIAAFVYGDGGVYKHGNNCRFEANCTMDHMDYILWRKSILENLTKVNTYELVFKNSANGFKHRKRAMKTYTRTHPTYTKVRNRLYLNNRKVFDPHYLKLFDWETLAIFFMDDGTCAYTPRHYTKVNGEEMFYNCTPKVSLATLSHSYADNWLLKKTIKDNLGIEFNINKHSYSENKKENMYQLVLRSKDYDTFVKEVSPFVLPSFMYKIKSVRRTPNSNEKGDEIVQTV